MRRSIAEGVAPAPPSDDDLADHTWAVSVVDDFDDSVARVVLLVEERGDTDSGHAAVFEPASARVLRAALGLALKELGEPLD